MNDTKMPTVEDIERKQKLLSVLIKVFFAILVLIACVFVGWLISFIGYADDAGRTLGHSLETRFITSIFH
jgi:hypothetical protein